MVSAKAAEVIHPEAEPESPETPVASEDAAPAMETDYVDLRADRPKTPAASEATDLSTDAGTPEAYLSMESEPEDASTMAERMPVLCSDEDQGTSGRTAEMSSTVPKARSNTAMKRNRVNAAPRKPSVEKRHKRTL